MQYQRSIEEVTEQLCPITYLFWLLESGCFNLTNFLIPRDANCGGLIKSLIHKVQRIWNGLNVNKYEHTRARAHTDQNKCIGKSVFGNHWTLHFVYVNAPNEGNQTVWPKSGWQMDFRIEILSVLYIGLLLCVFMQERVKSYLYKVIYVNMCVCMYLCI